MSCWPAIPTSLPWPTPFGSGVKSRGYSAGKYRFGFNGKEEDGETAADAYDFGARIYDARLGRWLSVDPETGDFCALSAFQSMNNNPILILDIDGKKILINYLEPKKDANGSFVIGPDGNLEMVAKSYEYGVGIAPPDNTFVKESIKALDYVCNSRKGNKEVNRAIKNKESITINELWSDDRDEGPSSAIFATNDLNGDGGISPNEFVRDENGHLLKIFAITWDPNSKAEIVDKNNRGTGKTSSAAILLVHELVHMNNAIKNAKKSIRKATSFDKRYDTKEERRTIRKERRISKQLDENKRYNHSGLIRTSKSSTEHDEIEPSSKKNTRGLMGTP